MITRLNSRNANSSNTTPVSIGMIQRKCNCGGKANSGGKCKTCADDEKDFRLNRKTTSREDIDKVPQIVHEVLRSPGQPLHAESRSYFEPRFGFDFSGVRIHYDQTAAQSAKRIDAEAYTVGSHIAFSEGRYRPGTITGDALLGHELTHVVQQTLASPGAQYDPASAEEEASGIENAISSGHPFDPPTTHFRGVARKTEGKKVPEKRTSKNNPKLQVSKSKQGSPCACIVFIHSNERNARLTATLIHDHCRYNLAMITPDSKSRFSNLANGTNVDPNELFPPKIVQECVADNKSCDDFLVDKADSTNFAEIQKHAQIQFFLAIKECSSEFSLPVVALHNNAVNDTATFRAKEDKAGVDNLKFDIDKSDDKGANLLLKLRELLRKKLGKVSADGLLDKKGTTNIFRWCQSNDLSKCHIGDPDHPDNVVWVINPADFKRLSTEPVNVALQSSAVSGGESDTDLSTVFVVLHQIFGKELVALTKRLQEGNGEHWLKEIFNKLLLILESLDQESIRYINIETPGHALSSQSDSERIRNYHMIVSTLNALGLHCCPAPLADEQKIESGLKIDEAKKKEKEGKK